jgi:hypothetical protein
MTALGFIHMLAEFKNCQHLLNLNKLSNEDV